MTVLYPDEIHGPRHRVGHRFDRATLSLFGNIVWLVCGGLLTSCLYFLGGLLLCMTLVGIPFGVAALRLGMANLAPFGKTVRVKPDGDSVARLIFNALWILCFGWGIAVTHLTSAFFLGITVVGLPWAIQHLKLIPLALLPFGRSFRP